MYAKWLTFVALSHSFTLRVCVCLCVRASEWAGLPLKQLNMNEGTSLKYVSPSVEKLWHIKLQRSKQIANTSTQCARHPLPPAMSRPFVARPLQVALRRLETRRSCLPYALVCSLSLLGWSCSHIVLLSLFHLLNHLPPPRPLARLGHSGHY